MSEVPDFSSIKHLDFKAGDTTPCEVQKQPWAPVDEDQNLIWYPGLPKVGPCAEQATQIVRYRACPCQGDVRRWCELNPGMMPEVVYGLGIITFAMCDKHIDYFQNHVEYPFVCPGCGVSFLHPGEVLIDAIQYNGN